MLGNYNKYEKLDIADKDIDEILAMPELADVPEELSNPHWSNLTHGRKATYTAGCRGPLCRLINKEEGRRKNKEAAIKAGRPYQASIHRDDWRTDALKVIIEWHLAEQELRRLRRRIKSA